MSAVTRRHFLQTTGLVAAAGLTVPEVTAAPQRSPEVPFRLGLVTYNVAKDWDVPTILKICKSTGIAPVELRTTHKHGVEPSLSKAERQEVRKQFKDAGVEIWGCGTVCEFHAPDQATVRKNVETCKQFVELVADLGGTGVKVRPNGLPKDVPVEKTLAQIGKALIECGKAAENAGVEIQVEVHGGGTQVPTNMKTIMQECGHKQVGVTWNSNPTDLDKNGSVAASFELLRPWMKSCHINDLTGRYPYRELFRLMRESKYDRVTLIELGWGMPDPQSSERFLAYYKALWRELAGG